jgi:cyclic pyranopterin phosphate synthase
MPNEDHPFAPSAQLMKPQEIETLARIFVDMGITKIRLTGGEPLVRQDAAEIMDRLASLPVELTLTTNGSRIHEFQDNIRNASIQSINLSLDTLKPNRFQEITRRNTFHTVWDNIHLLLDMGITPKINMVVMKGINEDEILDFIEITRDKKIEIRFIEFMPFTGNHWKSDQVFTLKNILDRIEEKHSIIRVEDGPNDTAKHYKIGGYRGQFAVISTMSSPFCSTCNRLRLTADGKMKNCLFSKTEMDLLGALRSGQDVKSLILDSLRLKAKERGGQMVDDFQKLNSGLIENRSMIGIGG